MLLGALWVILCCFAWFWRTLGLRLWLGFDVEVLVGCFLVDGFMGVAFWVCV